MRLRRCGLGLALGLGLIPLGLPAASLAPAPLQASAAASTTDPAYAAGYRAAYPLGEHDHQDGAVANAHKFRLYQQGSAGYRDEYGSREAYRSAYRSGFQDGYHDGYAAQPPAIVLAGVTASPAAPSASIPPAAAGAAPLPAAGSDTPRIARANGYREGYSVGQSDANRGVAYRVSASQEYQRAQVGYSAQLGPQEQYQLNFRSGFSEGYSDGFYHRLYNAQIGARPSPAPPLPTSQQRQAARPSGVYNNGLLIAQGTRIQATLNQPISTKTASVGDRFTLTVSVPVWVGSVAAIPAGSTIQGTVQQVERGGRLSGKAQLQLQYTTLTLPGQTPVAFYGTTGGVGEDAATVDQQEGTVNGQGAGTVKHAATGAAIGAVLGGILGGGGGILRGGAAGAAVGTAGVLLSHDRDLDLRQGEPVSVILSRPLELPPMNQGMSVSN